MIKASQAVADLKALGASPTAQLTQSDGTKVTYRVDRKYLRYLLRHDELWARSYAQYIAVKSGDTTLLKELAETRAEKNLYNQKQWSEDDFKPILKAMDALFTTLGWIK